MSKLGSAFGDGLARIVVVTELSISGDHEQGSGRLWNLPFILFPVVPWVELMWLTLPRRGGAAGSLVQASDIVFPHS